MSLQFGRVNQLPSILETPLKGPARKKVQAVQADSPKRSRQCALPCTSHATSFHPLRMDYHMRF